MTFNDDSRTNTNEDAIKTNKVDNIPIQNGN